MFEPDSTSDFLAKIGLNLALGLITSCYRQKTCMLLAKTLHWLTPPTPIQTNLMGVGVKLVNRFRGIETSLLK